MKLVDFVKRNILYRKQRLGVSLNHYCLRNNMYQQTNIIIFNILLKYIQEFTPLSFIAWNKLKSTTVKFAVFSLGNYYT